MNYNQHFDEHIKDQFADYTPPVHPRIWENIMAQREKRKPVGFWWQFFNGRTLMVLAAVLITAGATSYLLINKKGDENIKTVAAANTPATADTKVNATPQNNLLVENSNADLNNTSSTNSPATLNNNTGSNASVTQNHITQNTTRAVVNNFTYNSPFTSSAAYTKQYNRNSKQRVTVKNGVIFYSDAEEENNYSLFLSPFTALKNNSSKADITSLRKRNTLNVTDPGCPSIEKNAAGNKTYIEIYGGPDVAFRNLSDTGSSAYLQKRKESIKFSSAFSAGLRYTKVFNNGVSVRTGINYSQINEKFTYSQGNIIQVVYILNANGDTIGSYTTTGTRYKTTHNKFRTIDVPLVLGYELGNGKLHANINAGVMVNIYSWQKGEVLDANLQPVSITTGKSNSPYQFKTNIGTAFIGAVSLYYKVNDKLHVMAEPYFRYSLTPASKETITFKQKYNTAGLRLGVRLDLQ